MSGSTPGATDTYFDQGEYFVGSKSNYEKLPGGYNFLRRAIFWIGKVRRIKKYKRSGRVLDIGCAYGFLLYFMKEEFEVHGCDISGHAIQQCKKIFKEELAMSDGPVEKDQRFCVHDVTKPLPYPDKYFDVIICQDVIEHVENILPPLQAIKAALKDDGIFFFRVPIKTRFKATEVLRFERDPTHVSVLPERLLLKKLDEVGFVPLEKRYVWMGALPLPGFVKFGSDLNLILKKK